jgi:hypothetical protein
MNTKRSGSRSICCSNHARRSASTLERRCSAACAVFFKGDAALVVEPPERRRRRGDPARVGQTLGDLAQGDVPLLLDESEQEPLVPVELAALRRTPPWSRPMLAVLAPNLGPTDRRGRCDLEPPAGGARRRARRDRPHEPNPQIGAVGLRHGSPLARCPERGNAPTRDAILPSPKTL